MESFKNNELNRRKFLKYSSSVVLGSHFAVSALAGRTDTSRADINCQDIANHFKEIGKWVNWNETADTFKAGDPSRMVRKVAVSWKASWDAMREAVSKGADMFISHESICVNGSNNSTKPEVAFALPSEKPKFDWLEKTGLVVYRCHDVWDRVKNEGIRDTWQKGLNIGDKIIADEYPFYVTEVNPTTVQKLAEHVLKQVKPLKQNGVIVAGNMEKKVSKIGTGTGVNTQPIALMNIGADVGIMTDDYYLHVRMGVHANELDFPTIIVNHGVAEEWGVMNLARYVQRVFPTLEVFHIPQYCPYKIIV